MVEETIKHLNTNFFSLSQTKRGSTDYESPLLVAEELYNIPSENSDEYVKYINHCLSLGINRSFIFSGPPGVGKTTLAHTIIKNLGFKTFKFRYAEDLDFKLLNFIIDSFHIDAILIDDFDQISAVNSLLEFLEVINKKVKVVFSIANSIAEFHPAIIRPKRFDEIKLFNNLETDTIKELLGDLYEGYGVKVKNWPVAYINELSFRSKIGVQDIEEAFKELDKRVKSQLKNLKAKK